MNDNPYERYGATTPQRKPRKPKVVKSEKDAPMVLKGAEKAQAEESAQLARYRRHQLAARKALLEGEHSAQIAAVVNVLRALTPDSSYELLKCMDEFKWFAEMSKGDRAVVINMISDAIVRMRVQAGMSPFDDSLPGEDPTVFEICRKKLDCSDGEK